MYLKSVAEQLSIFRHFFVGYYKKVTEMIFRVYLRFFAIAALSLADPVRPGSSDIVCCKAMTADCIACSLNMSTDTFCNRSTRDTEGQQLHACNSEKDTCKAQIGALNLQLENCQEVDSAQPDPEGDLRESGARKCTSIEAARTAEIFLELLKRLWIFRSNVKNI